MVDTLSLFGALLIGVLVVLLVLTVFVGVHFIFALAAVYAFSQVTSFSFSWMAVLLVTAVSALLSLILSN